jgi:predicted permease
VRFEQDLVELFTDLHAGAARPRLHFWLRIAAGTLRHGLAERLRVLVQPPRAQRSPGDSAMTMLMNDVRLAVRAFRRRPGFTATVILTMALGIGVTSGLFTVVNAVLLRPLPYDRPEQVVMIFERDPRGTTSQVSRPAYDDWQMRLTSVSRLALFGSQTANLTGIGEPDRMRAGFVSAEFFRVLGVAPLLGRDFSSGEDEPAARGVAVLPYGVWARRFGSDPDILGRTLTLNNQPFDVIGVLPRSFEFPFDDIEVYLPLAATPSLPPPVRDRRALFVFGRLADGVSLETAAAELLRVTTQAAAEHPDTSARWTAEITPFHAVAVRLVRTPLYTLMAAAVVVLLIACANVANLTLAGGSVRAREMAVRAALGAGRWRLVTQLLTESVVLAVAGGGLGLLLGSLFTESLLAFAPPLPRGSAVSPDWAVVAFTAAISVMTGLLCGVVPAFRGSSTELTAGLQHAARTTDPARGPVKRLLLVAELALSLVLLVCAGLLAKSLVQMSRSDPGFLADHVLTMEYRLPRNKYTTPAAQWDVHRRIVEQVAEVPGVEAAALAGALPFSGNGSRLVIWRAEDPAPDPVSAPRVTANAVSNRYFEAMGIAVFAGRTCSAAETPDAPLSIVVNRALANQLWPGQSAVGQRLRGSDMPGEAVVIGVVGNTLHFTHRAGMAAQLYACFAQSPGLFASLVARTTADPMTTARAVQQAVWAVDPDQPVWKVRSLESLLASGADRERLVTTLMSTAAMLALLLAALGVFSVVSHSIAQRAREVSVRMALGASRGAILRLVLRETSAIVLIGIAIGLLGALGASRLIASQLLNVTPGDPLNLVLTAALLTGAALGAAAWPALRAASADPLDNLRE